MWDELARLNHTVRHHLYWHDELTISSVNLFSTKRPSSRVEIHVPGDRPEACTQILAWRNTLLDTSLHLEVGDDPGEPKVSVYGYFLDRTPVTVTAALSVEDVNCLDSNQFGDDVLTWLQAHAA
ncbi:hypothetical protein [Actinokineospora diospyrosa]|uniref:Uncharacterized protein n=1 Tax=Actinokineospora diospyrosa TaxID=103728 RepID=A0ABT1I9H8_9PSEU|nr:hypothetical protein [Actinokineospora diospyrosa]MCP2269293.1 hypothetical protein [Actinokineospora diospyrosa]